MSADILGEQNAQKVVESPTNDVRNLDRDLFTVFAGTFKIAFDLAAVTAEACSMSADLQGILFGSIPQRPLAPSLTCSVHSLEALERIRAAGVS
jgi:hypothetical protein